MTAPLTPPHQPQPNDPWQVPPSGSHALPGEQPDRAERRAEIRQAAVITGLLTVAGVGLGLLWLLLAPRVPLVSDDTAVFLKNSEGEEAIGADGTFVLLALAFGLVSAVVVFLFRRRGGIPLVVALAVGGLLGSLLAWGIGTWFGPTSDVVAHAKEVGKGVTFDAPLELHAVGAGMLSWPVAAMIVHLGLTALFGPRDPEPEWGAYGASYGSGASDPSAAGFSGAEQESAFGPGPVGEDGKRAGEWPERS
ncbi:ABC transporter permease [Streptomyces sp. NBC_00059]|uniref:ABC transporter permease n=1 Tax=Streptomyces sp. NBC_00059 TaxID=2975635 RepID=UPI0022519D93|nr:ABC transporter permease [Streptomyces sp. NBC_00059]MCX5413192.1 ABC transporter permease [Streptomyces sp. NBC_00059]